MCNRWVIPDIHGNIKTLVKLIGDLDTGNEEFYLLGDYCDRGPSSKEVYDYLMARTLDDPDRFNPLKGNHDAWLESNWNRFNSDKAVSIDDLNDYQSWLYNGGNTTLKSFGVEHVKDIPKEYIDWISKLPIIIVLEDYVLVHGGLNMYLSDPVNNTNPNDMMWERSYGTQTFEDKWPIPGKKLVVGHTVRTKQQIEKYISSGNNTIMLDNGCFLRKVSQYVDNTDLGSLTAFNLDTKELIYQDQID